MTYESTQASTCSSCTVMGDFSNYWVPQLYYQYPNGSFKSVDQAGGATVYYIQRGEEGEELFAFPEGLRMVAGNPFKRSPGNDFASQAISFGCLNFNEPATPETPNFPTTNCPDGLRSQVFFPSCWDGVNLDSADHMSHMSYPTTEYNNGPCPSTHPKHLISLFYEVTWNVNDFKDMWYGDKQPFVFSSGDPTGYGGHGDFFCGWNVTLLQTAVDECTNSSGKVEDCHVFNLTPDNVAEGCIVPSQVDEPVLGNLDKLPGCQTVDAGPATAPIQSNCGAVTTLSAPKQNYFSDLTSSLKWSYVGCGTDNYYNRILTGASESNDNMTVENCVNFCSSKGFSIAGTEYAQECTYVPVWMSPLFQSALHYPSSFHPQRNPINKSIQATVEIPSPPAAPPFPASSASACTRARATRPNSAVAGAPSRCIRNARTESPAPMRNLARRLAPRAAATAAQNRRHRRRRRRRPQMQATSKPSRTRARLLLLQVRQTTPGRTWSLEAPKPQPAVRIRRFQPPRASLTPSLPPLPPPPAVLPTPPAPLRSSPLPSRHPSPLAPTSRCPATGSMRGATWTR